MSACALANLGARITDVGFTAKNGVVEARVPWDRPRRGRGGQAILYAHGYSTGHGTALAVMIEAGEQPSQRSRREASMSALGHCGHSCTPGWSGAAKPIEGAGRQQQTNDCRIYPLGNRKEGPVDLWAA